MATLVHALPSAAASDPAAATYHCVSTHQPTAAAAAAAAAAGDVQPTVITALLTSSQPAPLPPQQQSSVAAMFVPGVFISADDDVTADTLLHCPPLYLSLSLATPFNLSLTTPAPVSGWSVYIRPECIHIMSE